jgi:succinate-semialdehyde dehydrogenase / glutarate-semialdehyde dehydrogenase
MKSIVTALREAQKIMRSNAIPKMRAASGPHGQALTVRAIAHDAQIPLQTSGFMQQFHDPALLKGGAWIGGEFCDARSNGTFKVVDPSTGNLIAHVADCREEDTREAVAHAASAFEPWAQRPARDRAKLLRRWYDEVYAAREDLSRLVTLECGKPLAESRVEVNGGTESIAWFAEEARRVCGEVLPSPMRDKRFMVLRQPVGVVAAITPWNFPFSMITRKVAPALAAGCTVVLKPSDLTPLTALALAELADRAGFPRGVLNVVPGSDAAAIGNVLMESFDVRKLTFTGSTAVGKKLAAQAAATVKKTSLELGGNAPFIIFEDADVEKAARDVVASSYRNAGQTCICTNRVLCSSKVLDAFVDALVARVSKLKTGSGLDPGVSMGPLINPMAVERMEQRVREAKVAGADVVIGGKRAVLEDASLQGGYFFEPTVLTNITSDMKVWSEESFGPLTPVQQFADEGEAVAMANNTRAGLAAYFYTKDLGRAWRVSEGLKYGMVGVNQVAITSEVAPFGGVKESGLGREHGIGHGLTDFLDLKTVCMGL